MNSFLHRFNVGKRLSLAFGVLILLSCALVAAGLYTLSQARERLDTIVNRNMAMIQYATDMLDANATISLNLRNIVLPTTAEQNRQFGEVIDAQRIRYKEPARQALRISRRRARPGIAQRAGFDARAGTGA